MKVSELIAALQKENPDADCIVWTGNGKDDWWDLVGTVRREGNSNNREYGGPPIGCVWIDP